jgi:hypothetical protein
MQDGLSIGLALWGAVLSTVLAAIKIWEVRREGLRLTTSYSFSTDAAVGNDVIIQNPSKNPVMISYWALLWLQRRWGRWIITNAKFPDEGDLNVTIAPFSQHVLSFEDATHFDWGASAVHKGKIWLKLYVVGRRRPVWLLVYDPKR